MRELDAPAPLSELAAVSAALALRASAIVFDIRMGPPGDFSHVG